MSLCVCVRVWEYEGTFLSARNSMICTGGVFNSFTDMY